MIPYFVGPMPPQEFLDTFLPISSDSSPTPSTSDVVLKPGMLSPLGQTSAEAGMYDVFVRPDPRPSPPFRLTQCFQVNIISPHIPNLCMANTSRLADRAPYTKFSFWCQPDCSLYDSSLVLETDLDSSLVELLIEFKTTPDNDPFVVGPVTSSGKAPEHGNPFINNSSQKLRQVLGQITAYATLVLGSQYRTHVFLVIVFKKYSRLLRWDRGGAVVTAPISHADELHVLDFLMRYSAADREARGHDPTVRRATEDEWKCVQNVCGLADVPMKSLLSVTIPTSDQPQDSKHYIIHAPRSEPRIPAGRWTRVSVAYDMERRQRVLLKDSWRVVLPDIMPEGLVYAKLHENLVPNIPHCSQAGDVGVNKYHESQTQRFVGKF